MTPIPIAAGPAPLVADDRVVCLLPDGLVELAADGSERLRAEIPAIRGAALLRDGIAVDLGDRVRVLDGREHAGALIGAAGSTLVVRRDERWVAVDARSGEVRWEADPAAGRVEGTVAIRTLPEGHRTRVEVRNAGSGTVLEMMHVLGTVDSAGGGVTDAAFLVRDGDRLALHRVDHGSGLRTFRSRWDGAPEVIAVRRRDTLVRLGDTLLALDVTLEDAWDEALPTGATVGAGEGLVAVRSEAGLTLLAR